MESVENMTATEELRALLDAKGVEWWPLGNDMTECVVDGVRIKYRQVGRGLIVSTCTEGTVTPAQAVEATLGRGTCRMESMHGYTDPYVATRYVVELSCHTLDDWPESELPIYCPWCGAKVVSE